MDAEQLTDVRSETTLDLAYQRNSLSQRKLNSLLKKCLPRGS